MVFASAIFAAYSVEDRSFSIPCKRHSEKRTAKENWIVENGGVTATALSVRFSFVTACTKILGDLPEGLSRIFKKFGKEVTLDIFEATSENPSPKIKACDRAESGVYI